MKRTSLQLRYLLAMVLMATLVAVGVPAQAADELPAVDSGFGDYALVPMLGDEPAYAGPATPTSLDEVTLTDQVDELLSPEARAKLAEQGFVIVPEEFRLFHHAYDEQFYAGTPVFVTTDAAYHAWHQVFDKTLRDLETRRLTPALATLLKGMRKHAVAQQDALAGTELEDDAARVVDLLAVAAAELGLKSGKLSRRAKAEKALIDKHSDSTDSPILGTETDYSLFTPRGHYTRTKELTRYFMAMSVLGQHAFRLPGSVQTDATIVEDTDNLRLALLASRTLVGDPGWRRCGATSSSRPHSWSASRTTTRRSSWRLPSRPRFPAAWTIRCWPRRLTLLLDIADTLTATRPVQHRSRAALGPADGHALRHRLLDLRPAGRPQRGRAAPTCGSWPRRSTWPRPSAPTSRWPSRTRPGRRPTSTTPSRWQPCGRPWRRVPTRPGARRSTTPGWPRSSRCGCRTAPPSRTSCRPTPGRPSRSRRASAPTPSSSTTPSSTPSSPSARWARACGELPRCATGWSRTRWPSGGSRPWPR